MVGRLHSSWNGPFSRNMLIFGFVTHYNTLYTYKHLSNEKNPGWLGYKRDYTTQLYREETIIRIPIYHPVYSNGKEDVFFSWLI